MECELCGSKDANKKTKIDNAILTVCKECVKFGEEVPILEVRSAKKILPKIEELEHIIPDFHKVIRNAREKMKLTQEELAKKLNEKSSIIKRIEEGWKPSSSLIAKVERFFNIKLTEKLEEKQIDKKVEEKKLTIGDIVEVY
jgi:putative transcription factor